MDLIFWLTDEHRLRSPPTDVEKWVQVIRARVPPWVPVTLTADERGGWWVSRAIEEVADSGPGALKHIDHCVQLTADLRAAGLRVRLDSGASSSDRHRGHSADGKLG